MLARSFFLLSATPVLVLASVGDAEARRLKLFTGFSRATTAERPAIPTFARAGATPGAAAPPAAAPGRAAIGTPVVAPLPALGEERRAADQPALQAAVPSQPPVPEKRRGPAFGFETVSAESATRGGFETLSVR